MEQTNNLLHPVRKSGTKQKSLDFICISNHTYIIAIKLFSNIEVHLSRIIKILVIIIPRISSTSSTNPVFNISSAASSTQNFKDSSFSVPLST